MDVKRIKAADTYALRHAILRQGYPIEDCHFIEDDNESTFHLGAFVDKKLVSIASFYFENHPTLDQYHVQFRLRGMATAHEHQRKGLSKALLKTAIPLIKQNQGEILWCNARTSAEGFYKNVGFIKVGDVFDISKVGPHVLMYFHINPPVTQSSS